jgi:hypothetical protein
MRIRRLEEKLNSVGTEFDLRASIAKQDDRLRVHVINIANHQTLIQTPKSIIAESNSNHHSNFESSLQRTATSQT